MDDSWIPVYSASQLYKAELIRQVLAQNQITSFILNQQDSFYLFGNIEVCVKQGDVIRAKHILKSL